jgi:5'-3' exonuclease
MIIACDNKNYWRKQIFPYYKANRKKNIESSEMNWQAIFECMNKIRAELKEYFPYRVIEIESAEADDIIATLVKENSEFAPQDILILSGDKDFIQLHRYNNVKQYDPTRKKWVSHPDPNRYLEEHILKGDSGDGIPNVLSEDNTFVVGSRQKPLTQKKIEYILENNKKGYERNWSRNAQLIDLSYVPAEIREKVLESFNSQKDKKRDKMFNYFIANKLKHLMEHIGEF